MSTFLKVSRKMFYEELTKFRREVRRDGVDNSVDNCELKWVEGCDACGKEITHDIDEIHILRSSPYVVCMPCMNAYFYNENDELHLDGPSEESDLH